MVSQQAGSPNSQEGKVELISPEYGWPCETCGNIMIYILIVWHKEEQKLNK